MIDDHVHPFPLEFEPLDTARFTLDVHPGDEADAHRLSIDRTRVASQMLLVRLAGHLGCAVDECLAARNALAVRDWPAYVRGLFADADVNGMVFDAGWHGLAAGTAAPYASLSGTRIWELARIETVLDRELEAGASAADALRTVDAFMDRAVQEGVVGFKTVIAYRTGLAVDVTTTRDRAERELAADRDAGIDVRRSGKGLRDLVFLRMLERCAELQRPLQVHTGIGDSDIRLRESNPLLLDEALRTPAAGACDVVLIHGSFPWLAELGYLASVRPRVWAELSLSNLFSPATTADQLLRLVDIAPTARITLGSDGHGAPESHWFGALMLRDAWTEVRQRLQPLVGQRWLDETQDRLFSENARTLYRLDL